MKPSEKQTDKIDQLFKNKLEEHSLPPSEHAWNGIEAALLKKNKAWVWRLAAGVVLAGLLLALLYQRENKEPVLAKSQMKNPVANTQPQQKSAEQSGAKNQTSILNQKKSEGNYSIVSSTQHKTKPTNTSVSQKIIIIDTVSSGNQTKTNLAYHPEEEKIKPEATPVASVASSTRKPIKLEFTLDDFSTAPTVATAVGEKKSGIKKFLELARDVKKGEAPLTGLKEIKDEILARGFFTKQKNN